MPVSDSDQAGALFAVLGVQNMSGIAAGDALLTCSNQVSHRFQLNLLLIHDWAMGGQRPAVNSGEVAFLTDKTHKTFSMPSPGPTRSLALASDGVIGLAVFLQSQRNAARLCSATSARSPRRMKKDL